MARRRILPLFPLLPPINASLVMAADLTVSVSISVGAILGALARYFVTLFCAQRLGNSFPIGTFMVNLLGCILIGFFATLIQAQAIELAFYPFIITGFLGGFTTFSTYALDTSNLLTSKRYRAALLYWLGSASLGLLSVILGMKIAQIWLV